eukprot:CAMPEP_0183327868 /NCGR_PEP_ID=MMETSP0160_2-20130417/83987_1 /TAXON_ID=2839 ORGANISM="Odontella Sinensis, Strain Grunow 1884" /NCGR_SAMPLE_ID=MMETSP0160_2 /ASSEMBLY_ACC=CAM_ASM_000250 /LENGTH=139 /DNA_ID=CAMNT_0025496013 /DNA_START=23 /DNA_END=443 /DNA_ORIENTATION=-
MNQKQPQEEVDKDDEMLPCLNIHKLSSSLSRRTSSAATATSAKPSKRRVIFSMGTSNEHCNIMESSKCNKYIVGDVAKPRDPISGFNDGWPGNPKCVPVDIHLMNAPSDRNQEEQQADIFANEMDDPSYNEPEATARAS